MGINSLGKGGYRGSAHARKGQKAKKESDTEPRGTRPRGQRTPEACTGTVEGRQVMNSPPNKCRKAQKEGNGGPKGNTEV